jgi:hypothetical protein
MRPNAVGQVGVTPWALLKTDVEWIDRGNFAQSKPDCTLSTLSDRVIPTVDGEKHPLFGG